MEVEFLGIVTNRTVRNEQTYSGAGLIVDSKMVQIQVRTGPNSYVTLIASAAETNGLEHLQRNQKVRIKVEVEQ